MLSLYSWPQSSVVDNSSEKKSIKKGERGMIIFFDRHVNEFVRSWLCLVCVEMISRKKPTQKICRSIAMHLSLRLTGLITLFIYIFTFVGPSSPARTCGLHFQECPRTPALQRVEAHSRISIIVSFDMNTDAARDRGRSQGRSRGREGGRGQGRGLQRSVLTKNSKQQSKETISKKKCIL